MFVNTVNMAVCSHTFFSSDWQNLDFKRKTRTITRIRTSDLQICNLALYHLNCSGSFDGTSPKLSPESHDIQVVVVCDKFFKIQIISLYLLITLIDKDLYESRNVSIKFRVLFWFICTLHSKTILYIFGKSFIVYSYFCIIRTTVRYVSKWSLSCFYTKKYIVLINIVLFLYRLPLSKSKNLVLNPAKVYRVFQSWKSWSQVYP